MTHDPLTSWPMTLDPVPLLTPRPPPRSHLSSRRQLRRNSEHSAVRPPGQVDPQQTHGQRGQKCAADPRTTPRDRSSEGAHRGHWGGESTQGGGGC